MAREIARAEKRYPQARYLGIADGTASTGASWNKTRSVS